MVSHSELLRSQWAELRTWIGTSGLLDHAQEPSVLEAWNVHELVTHVGRLFLGFPLLGPAKDATPLSLRQYIADYGASSREISDGTKQLARSFAGDVLGGIDSCARIGFRALAGLRTDVVRGPLGTITLDDFILTRIIELVVHGDDLARSVPQVVAPPLLDISVQAVSDALAGAYREATGHEPSIDIHLDWIRVATGRAPAEDSSLPLL